MANFAENEIDTVSRDLRYLISLGKVNQQQTIADIAEKTLELLKSQPQIVRCKDCKHWDCVNNSYYGKCSRVFKGKLSPFDWFCANGELKDDG